MNSFTLLSLFAAIGSASAINCYFGESYTGTVPTDYMVSCGTCWKSVQTYTSAQTKTTHTYTQWGGNNDGGNKCTAPPPTTTTSTSSTSTTTTLSTTTPAWSPIYKYKLTGKAITMSSTCNAYGIDYYITNPTTAAPSTGTDPTTTTKGWSCSTTQMSQTCNTGTDSGTYAYCTCCSDNCNGGLACAPPSNSKDAIASLFGSASSVSAYSMVSLLLLAINFACCF